MKHKRILSGMLAAALAALFFFGMCPTADSILHRSGTVAAAASGSTELADYAQEVAEIVNRERAANGLSPLTFSARLSAPAQVRAAEIQSVFSHTRPDGRSCFTALDDAGIRYTYAGENIAYGQRSPEAVMDAWMHSDGHRANILNTRVTYIGVGVAERGGVYYWTQFFAASDALESAVPAVPVAPVAPVVTTPAQTTRTTTAATTAASTTRTTAVTTSTAAAPVTTKTTAAPAATVTTATTTTSSVTTTTAAASGLRICRRRFCRMPAEKCRLQSGLPCSNRPHSIFTSRCRGCGENAAMRRCTSNRKKTGKKPPHPCYIL